MQYASQCPPKVGLIEAGAACLGLAEPRRAGPPEADFCPADTQYEIMGKRR